MGFNAIQTTALAICLILLGYGLRSRIRILDRLNIPVPVIGGLLMAIAVLVWKNAGQAPVKFDTAIQSPVMIAFFTTLGFSASVRLLRQGGPQVLMLFVLASALAVVQCLLGAAVALAFGLQPVLGALIGTATLSGGPATGLAFAPQFEAVGISGAGVIATATGMSGIVLASVFAAPLATWIISRRKLTASEPQPVEILAAETPASATHGHAEQLFLILKVLAVVVVAMWLGGEISGLIQARGITLPPYIGSMLVAAAIRNLDDYTGWLKLPLPAIEVAGAATLSIFLVMAMMTLDLGLLAGLALPLVANLVLQGLLVLLLAVGPVWWLMGRDYEAAVTAGGFVGFMLGTTANAMAAMRSLVEKYAAAPRSFLAVPIVGAFFVDFVNAIVITTALNVLP